MLQTGCPRIFLPISVKGKALRLVREPNSEFFSIDKGVLSLGLNLPRRATDHSSPQSAEVKNVWSYISILAIWLHRVHRDNFK